MSAVWSNENDCEVYSHRKPYNPDENPPRTTVPFNRQKRPFPPVPCLLAVEVTLLHGATRVVGFGIEKVRITEFVLIFVDDGDTHASNPALRLF